MGVFQFKRFAVVNERSAMKVNTDGVLLGAVMNISPDDRNLLDIGTGTGTIAMMAAQRLDEMFIRSSLTAPQDNECVPEVTHDCHRSSDVILNEEKNRLCVQAIDIDEPSATEAAANFRNSPWSDILQAHNVSLDNFSTQNSDTFDLVFSNPPYFDNALQAPEERRNAARHTATGLSYREILNFAKDRLAERGRVAMVLPSETEHDLTRHARMCSLYLNKITRIRTVPRKTPCRIIAEFSRQRIEFAEDVMLTIQNEGQYTQEYLSIMKDFYLFA